MKSPTPKQLKRNKGFSMVEIMIAISVLAILVLIAVATITKVKPAAELSKLTSDVQNLNTAIKVYKHSGGDLSTATTAPLVVAKLKTVRQKSTVQSFVGYTGSMVDSRLVLVEVPAGAKGGRAIYDSAKERFTVTTAQVAGYKLTLDDSNDPGEAIVEETRAESVLKYSKTSNWVWDYQDVAPPARLDPTLVTRVQITNPTPNGPDTVDTPDGPATPTLEKLLPPVFNPPTDYYPISNFPMTVSITNPNGSGGSKIVYGIINAQNWQWLDYTGPISVGPGDKVLAFVESLKPREFHHSDPVDEQYHWVAPLSDPTVSVTESDIDARTGSTTVTINHNNNSSYFDYNGKQLPISPNAFSVQYKLVPLVAGQGTETDWTDYTQPFDIGGPQFPRGFQVVARVSSNSPNFTNSGEASETVNAHYKLDPPIVNSSIPVITDPNEVATVTLTNPNPQGSSNMVYRILDANGNPTTGWLNYNAPFQVAGSQFPKGFTIEAKATPLDNYYRESDQGNASVDVNFFGIEVTGRTIFVLDSSGSMSTNDRIGRLKSAATTVLNVFDADDQFAIIEYDSSPKVLIGWGPGSTARKNSATTAINGMNAGGGTLYAPALQAAIGLNASGADQIIFLSDGMPNDGDPNVILGAIDTLVQRGLKRFDTVSLGTDQPILDTMAQRGKGKKVKVKD